MATLGFTPAKEQDIWTNNSEETAPLPNSLSGSEARSFYQSVVQQTDGGGHGTTKTHGTHTRQITHNTHRTPPRGGRHGTGRRGRASSHVDPTGGGVNSGREEHHPTRSAQPSGQLPGLRLLRCAQEGDVSGLKDLISRGVDINFQDSFFWTAIMCASWAGQRAAVRLLLGRGAAWVGVVDTRGRDARELAQAAGHQGIVEELDGFATRPPQVTQHDRRLPVPQWCETCGSHFSGPSLSHHSSTLHQFSLRRQPPAPAYCLPASSAGYRMMLRCGWDPRAGLGPDGDGPRQPVSTVLKRDHRGLGYGPLRRARVTHFPPRDPQAVRAPGEAERKGRGGDKGARKEESRRRQETERSWERDFRSSFHLSQL